MNLLFAKVKKLPKYLKHKTLVFLYKIQMFRRKFVVKKQIQRLENKNFTLISNNCNGCVLLHELGLKFNSQFVNLSINAVDYIKYLKNFDYYNSLELSFVEDGSVSYPVGLLGDLRIDFVHYKSPEEAREKWNDRKKRINIENMYVIFTEQGDCTEECVKSFDELPFENKVVFTCKPYNDIKSAIFVKNILESPREYICFWTLKTNFP